MHVGISLADVVAEEQVWIASLSCIHTVLLQPRSALIKSCTMHVGISLADVVAEEQVWIASLSCIHTVLLQPRSGLIKSCTLHVETWVGGVRLCQVCWYKVFCTIASSVQAETLNSAGMPT